MDLLNQLKYVAENKYSAFFYTPPKNADAKSFIFRQPCKIIFIKNKSEIETGFNEIEYSINSGLNGFSIIPFETGYIFEERLNKYFKNKSEQNLFEFYFYDNKNTEICLSDELLFENLVKHTQESFYSTDNYKLNTSKDYYCKSIEKIKNYIEEGDTYQVNFTVKANFQFNGDLIKFIYSLIYNQSAEYTAVINLGDKMIISISPELFFIIENNRIKVKPMKGTARRGFSLSDDNNKKTHLKNDAKNRAENVMIVDLLRNDLGRICNYDSVKTTSLFDIETYETLHQMTSTVIGDLKENNIYEILKNIFPSGSITGAPKIRTMEIIKELEIEERGYYTGTIGLFVEQKIIFNIPIRTIVINEDNSGEIGIGSGVVWDSDAEEEYNETLLKADFLNNKTEQFDLFETMLFENGQIYLFDYHTNRIKNAARYFIFRFDEDKFKMTINSYINSLDKSTPQKIKVFLNKWGEIKLINTKLDLPKKNIRIKISSARIDETNKYLYFKTTNRSFYEKELELARTEGYDEVIFFNKKEELTEGSITNIFLKINNNWFTPEIDSGLLNGCYREYLLQNEPDHISKKLFMSDLLNCENIKCVNSLRREMFVTEIYMDGKLIKKIE